MEMSKWSWQKPQLSLVEKWGEASSMFNTCSTHVLPCSSFDQDYRFRMVQISHHETTWPHCPIAMAPGAVHAIWDAATSTSFFMTFMLHGLFRFGGFHTWEYPKMDGLECIALGIGVR